MQKKLPRGRPKESSYRVYQLLYTRLLKGPLWLEDWASTGIKSRSTVSKRLQYLYSKKLIKKRRDGHKKLYELAPLRTPNGIVTIKGLHWHFLLHPLSRKEKRQANNRLKKQILPLLKENEKSMTVGARLMMILLNEIERVIESPAGKETIGVLEKAGIDWKEIPELNFLRFLVYPSLLGTLCLDCLKNRQIVFLMTDHERGEVICPIEGEVKRMEPFETHKSAKERPSPFVLPED